MNKDAHDVYCIFRRIGSNGLVIFEQDDLLVRRKISLRNLMLGDINNDLVEMLKQLREQNVLFGFVSHQTGVAAGIRGWPEYVGLTRMLDDLLSVRGALPDFWVAWTGSAREDSVEFRNRRGTWRRRGAEMIWRAIDWYGIDKNKTVFVSSSSASTLAANDADITGIQYSGWRSDRTVPARPVAEACGLASPSEIMEVGRLRACLEQILGLAGRRTD
jgi:histidinol phosphatase-like enzyme